MHRAARINAKPDSMKSNIILSVFLLLGLLPSAVYPQVYVSPSNYLYLNGNYVFVKNDVNLSGGNIYLRDQAQWLQGTAGVSGNSGVGKLSLYQEGTVNQYQYNYWCSPVGNASATAGNENFGITMLHSPVTEVMSTPASVLTGYNGVANPLGIAQYWIFKFLSSDTYSQWIQAGASVSIGPGEGFTMKGTAGTDATAVQGIQNNPDGQHQRYDFRGKPNDGNIAITVANNKLTLTGNPYPSAIDLSAFLTDETNCTGVAYFWEHDKTVNSHNIAAYRGGYGVYSPVSRSGTGIYVPATYYSYDGSGNPAGVYGNPNNSFERYFSPIGQGFMIEGNAGGSTATMKNSYRVYVKESALDFSQFERMSVATNDFLPDVSSVSGFDYTQVSKLPVPQIRFNILMNNQGIRQIALGFDSQATDGIDRAKDAVLSSFNAPAEAYFVIDDKKIAINVLDYDLQKKIPLGFQNEAAANYKITVVDVLNFDQAENIYVHDLVTDQYYDIKNDFYDFTLPAGTCNDRYEITFLNAALHIDTSSPNSFFVHQDNSRSMLSIDNPLQANITSLKLFDATGKNVMNEKQIGTNAAYEFSTAKLPSGVYIVRLSGDFAAAYSKKIVITNN